LKSKIEQEKLKAKTQQMLADRIATLQEAKKESDTKVRYERENIEGDGRGDGVWKPGNSRDHW
jgi:hypothetical protein